MANEFKVKKGLIVHGSGSTILDVRGSQGQLFSVTDSLSGSLFSVGDISGIPIIDVRSDAKIGIGTSTPAEKLHVYGGNVLISGSAANTTLKIEDGATGAPITLQSSGGGEAFIYIGSELSSIRRTGGDLNFFANAIDMKFSTNNGSTSTLFLDTSHNATFAGNVTVGSTSTNAARSLTIQTNAEQDSVLNLMENTGYGFSLNYDGVDNDFIIKRHDNSVAGVNVLTLFRENNNATFAGSVHLDNDAAQLQLGDGNDMQIFHNGANGEINISTGDFTIDSAGDITLDAGGADIFLKDDGTEFGLLANTSNNLVIMSRVQDKDIIFKGNDGGTTIEALKLDMSALGLATFSGNGVFNTALKINAPDDGGAPAMTAILDMHGYEGRGVGIKIRDSVNSASGASNREWFVGSGYAQSGFNIGYAADGSQSSYAAQNKFFIDTSGNVTIYGTLKPSGNGAADLGGVSNRWATVYAANINTSTSSTFGHNIVLDDNVDHSPEIQWINQANESWEMYNNSSGKFQIEQAGTQRIELSSGGLELKNGGGIVVSAGASDQTSNADSATVPATTGAEFLRIQHPSYTNGQYTTEFAKIDRSGNLPVYIRQSKATANSFSNIARFGDHDTNNPGQFAVFGDMELDGFVIHGGDVDTKFGFNGANDFKVHTGGSDRFSVTGDVHVLGSTDFAIPAGRKLYLDGQNNTYITEGSDGVIDFYGDGTHLVSMKQNGTQNEVVINESSGDVDFRVEANNYSHAFFVEAQDKGYIGVGTDGPYNGTRMHILGDDTSPSFDGTAIDDTTLVLSNSDAAYGTVFGTFGNGDGVIQQRRMSSAVYYDLNLNPYGGNVGIGTTDAHDQLHVQSTLRVGPHFSSNDRDHIRLVPHGTDTRIQSPNERFHIENFLGHIIISASAVGGVGIANEGADVTAPSASLHVKSTTGDVLLVEGSGSTILDVQGSQGQLFSVSDQLTGSLFKVADISGIPVFEAFDDDRVIMGAYGQNTLYVKGSSTLGEGAVGINTNPSVGSGLHVVGVGTGKAGIRIGRDDGISTGKQLEFAVSSTYDALISGDANKLSLIPSGSSPSFEFNKSGAVKFSGYGSGTHSGTATKTLAVDSSGNVIEIDGGGTIDGSGAANRLAIWSDSDTLTSDSDFTVDGDTIFTTNLEASNNILAGGDVTVNGGDFNLTKQNGSPTINFLRDGTNPGTNTLLHYLNFKVDYDGAHQDWGGIEHRTNASSVRTDLRFNVKSQSGNVQTGLSIVGQPSAVPNSTFAGDLTVSGDLFASGTNGLKINTTADFQTSAERLTVNGLGVIRNSSDSAATLYIQNHSTTTSTIQPYIFLADSGGNRGGLGVETSTAIMSVNGQGGLKFQTGASGVAGSEALLIDNSQNAKFAGKVGIGTTAASFHADADDLVVGGGSGNTGITINSGTTGFGSIYFADGTADDATEKRGQIRYLQGTERMDFHTDNVATSAFSILANGNLKSNNSISAAGKIAVKSSGPHASYDFYNDGTSYFNGAVTIDSSITQTGTTADSVIASFAHNAFDSRQVGMPGRFMVGPLGNGYPSIGYNFTTGGDVYTKITNDTSWGIHFGVSNKMSFLYNAAGTGTFTWSELMSLNTSGNLSISGVALFNDGNGINFGNSNAKIYGSSANGIQFNSNGSEAMRLNQSGNLGIGTTSPQGKVDVNGDLRVTRTIVSNSQYEFISLGSNRTIDDYGGLNKDYWRIGIITPGSNTTGESSAHGFGSLVFSGVTGANTTYVNRMVIEAGGNVGIGTNNPESKLTVEKNDATTYNAGDDGAQRDKGPTILLKNENTTDNSFGQIVFDSQGTDQGVARIVFLDTGTASTEMAFVTENSNSKGERMRISQGGNVGIGTSSPNISAFTTAVTLDANDAGYEIASSGTLTAILSGNSNGAGLHGIGAAGIRFFSAASGTTTERMRITSAGKVGIGTTSPGYLLSTAGTIRAEGMSTSPGSGVGLELRYDTSSNYGSVLSYDRANSAYKELRLEGSVINLREAGSNILTVDGGKVGIGTTSPGHLLEVRGTGDAVSIGNDTNNSSYIRFANTRGFVGYTGTDMMIQAGSGKNLRLGVNSNSFNNGVAMYIKSDGNVGIGTTSPTEKLAVNGNIETTTSGAGRKIGFNTGDNFSFNSTTIAHYGISNAGNETAGGVILSGYYGIRFASQGNIRGHISQAGLLTMANDVVAFGSPSDKSLKENIKPINNALDKVKNLKGVTFKWKEAGLTNLKEDIGFIAQDVQEVLPELVRENEDGKLSLRDKGIIPMLVEAVKELSAEVESLKKQLNK